MCNDKHFKIFKLDAQFEFVIKKYIYIWKFQNI